MAMKGQQRGQATPDLAQIQVLLIETTSVCLMRGCSWFSSTIFNNAVQLIMGCSSSRLPAPGPALPSQDLRHVHAEDITSSDHQQASPQVSPSRRRSSTAGISSTAFSSGYFERF